MTENGNQLDIPRHFQQDQTLHRLRFIGFRRRCEESDLEGALYPFFRLDYARNARVCEKDNHKGHYKELIV